MKIAVLGASGRAGSRIVAEALRRGHEVTGIARDAGKLASAERLTLRNGDALSPGLAGLLRGHDVVVSSMRFASIPAAAVLGAVKEAGVKRLIVVGGAGSLEVAPGLQLIDTPQFPDAYRPEASAGRDFLNALRAETSLDWTFLSPSALFEPGERTGKFRLGGDQLLADAAGQSRISMDDYAIALVDEIEAPKHVRQRFTVGY